MTAAGARTPRDQARWKTAAEEHQAALAAFVETAAELDGESWQRPRGEGKWSPAQIVEHLALTYEAALRELEGAGAMQARVGPWQQRILRWFLLPHILYHRHFPLRSRSPREIRPAERPAAEPREALERLESLGERFEERLRATWEAGGGAITNPYFGSVPPLRALRFVAVHLEHHRRQLPVRSGE